MTFEGFLILLAAPGTIKEIRLKLNRGASDSLRDSLLTFERRGLLSKSGDRWELTADGKRAIIRNLSAIRRLTQSES